MNKKLFIIETVSMHRMAYCIEATSQAEAEEFLHEKIDSSAMIDEMGQHHIGETLFSAMEADEDTYIELFDSLNDYLKDLPRERKLSYVVRDIHEN